MNKETLERFASKTIYIMRETKSQFKNPCLLWSMGKDSTLMLYLCKEAFFGEIPFDVVHIDTGYKFPEMYAFRDKLEKEWALPLMIERYAKGQRMIHPHPDKNGHEFCCSTLKTRSLKEVIEIKGYDAVIVGIRRDEHGVRGKERYMSPRDKDFKWNVSRPREGGDSGLESLQDPEMGGWDIYATEFAGAQHVRVHPILHWCEQDVWEYISWKGIPVVPLYFARDGERYRSLGCTPCTEPIKSSADTIDKILEELEKTKIPERSGRVQDKEEEAVMERLREWGYL